MNVPGLAVEVGHAVLRLGLVPDDRDLARVAGRDPRPEDARVRRVRDAYGFVQVFPRSFVEIIRIWFGAGVSAPLQPPLVPAWRVFVSQTT